MMALPLPYFFLQWGRPFSGIFVLMAASAPVLAAWSALKANRAQQSIPHPSLVPAD
jgi:hypothetical protein